jgi:hypothetical protein
MRCSAYRTKQLNQHAELEALASGNQAQRGIASRLPPAHKKFRKRRTTSNALLDGLDARIAADEPVLDSTGWRRMTAQNPKPLESTTSGTISGRQLIPFI